MITIAKNYDAAKDYSAEIAKTADPAEREKLLEERQNKIDDLGLAGRVADNAAVSKWTTQSSASQNDSDGSWIGGSNQTNTASQSSSGSSSRSSSQPYYASYGSGIDIGGLYDAIEQARLKAFEKAREANSNRLESSLAGIDKDYTDSVRNAQIRSRISALGNEEKLAALGLNFGSAYQAPTSGYTETSRINQDNNLKTNLNDLETAKETARGAAMDTINTANAQLDKEAAAYTSEINLRKIADMLSQYNADRDYSLKAAQLEMDQWNKNQTAQLEQDKLRASLQKAAAELETQRQKQESDEKQTAKKQADERAQTTYGNALERWKLYGSVLPADEAVLGVPAGTKTSAQAYQDAKYKLEQMKTLYQISK